MLFGWDLALQAQVYPYQLSHEDARATRACLQNLLTEYRRLIEIEIESQKALDTITKCKNREYEEQKVTSICPAFEPGSSEASIRRHNEVLLLC
jgi:hypothetical protein